MNKELIRNNERFISAIENLNEAQKTAVKNIEGPTLVVAGPGTGKTQILAARIGQILLETQTDCHSILCLTYTDAGTIAMRKRLQEFIGPDAYRVNISTFHAFCNDIIQENLDYFGKLNLEPISELEQIDLLQNLIDTLPKDSKLRKFTGDIYSELPRLRNLFSVMKKENWSKEFLEQKIDEYLADLPTREEYIYKRANAKTNIKVGDLKVNDLKKQQDKMDSLRAAIHEYPRFQNMMAQIGRYDYEDMILWVLNAFKNDESILRPYQERYQYILVDEYQDTSGSQNEILQQLLNFYDNPNIFVVGDDDQSIYRFQGANLNNIVDYASTYVDSLQKIVLTENYRSSQPILDAAKSLIEQNFERLTRQLNLDKNLKASNPKYNTLSNEVIINEYETPLHEAIHIGQQIEALIQKGVDPKEIAVIYRNHSNVEYLLELFKDKNIPVNIKKKENILQLNFVKKVVNILRYIALERDSPYSGDQLLFEIMHYDFFDLKAIDIAKLSIQVSKSNYSYQNSSKDDKSKTSLRRLISEQKKTAKPDLFNAEINVKGIEKFTNDVEFWIKESYNITPQELFEKIILRAGILGYIMKSNERSYYMEVLSSLFNFLKEENRKNPELTIDGFIELFDLMKDNKVALEINRSSYSQSGVQLLSVHGSKGLEFDYVFLIQANKKIWDKLKKSSYGNYTFPDTLFISTNEGSELEESRRLFYVGITRPRTHLTISYHKNSIEGKELEASQFIAEIINLGNSSIHKINPNMDDLIAHHFGQFREQEQPQITLLDKNYIDELLVGYTLSVTHLSSYLDCPLKFYFQNLVRVPSGKSPSATFGQAVHWGMNKLFRELPENEYKFPPASFLVDSFKWYMNRNRDSFSKQEYKLRLEYGEKILPEYYNSHVANWHANCRTEFGVKNVEVAGVPIKGNLDKVEVFDNYVNVVDYKTGKFSNAKSKLKEPSEQDENGGDYWRQAVFYKILLDNDRSNNMQVNSSIFEFVEPNDGVYPREKIVITDEHVKIVTQQITSTYSKILNHEFDKGCGKENCSWCNFVKTNFDNQHILVAESDE
jgi:DNA helicase-2/ATP-dependent DNA helicase PcrA